MAVFFNFLLLTAFLLLFGCAEKKRPPTAVKGVLDLTGWNFNKNGAVKLKGEWEFYWRQLLVPDNFFCMTLPPKTGFSVVPNYWEGQVVNGIPLHYRGYATLRLKVLMPQESTALSLKIDRLSGASKVWLNGELLTGFGILGTSSAEIREVSCPPVFLHLTSAGKSSEFVIQLANFHMHAHFGALFSISLGQVEDLQRKNYLCIGINLLMMGASMIMGFYHLILFLFRTQNRSNLYFGALCLLYGGWLIYNGVCGGQWFHVLLPGVPWQMKFIGSYWVLVSMPVCLIMFVHSLFPQECSKKVVRLAQVVFGSWAVMSCFVPFISEIRPVERLVRVLYHPTIRPSEILLVVLAVYIIGVILLAAKRKRGGAHFMLVSFLYCLWPSYTMS